MRAFAEKFTLNHFLNAWPQDLSFDEVIELVDGRPEQVTPRLHYSRQSLDAFLMRQMFEELMIDLSDEFEPGKCALIERFTMTRLLGHGHNFISPLFNFFVHTAIVYYAESVLADDPKSWPKNSLVTFDHWTGIARETLDILKEPESD